MIDERFGQTLRQIRLSKNLSIQDVYRKTGVAATTIAGIELKRRCPSKITLMSLIQLYEISDATDLLDMYCKAKFEELDSGTTNLVKLLLGVQVYALEDRCVMDKRLSLTYRYTDEILCDAAMKRLQDIFGFDLNDIVHVDITDSVIIINLAKDCARKYCSQFKIKIYI